MSGERKWGVYQRSDVHLADIGTNGVTDRFRGLATAAAFASLLSYAVVLFITPASNNEIARIYHASLGQLGVLPLALMIGFFSAVLLAGHHSDKHGKLPAILSGCVSMAAGALIFGNAASFGIAIVASFLMGVGGGLSEATSMALISDLYSDAKRTAMANLSQAMFGVGAVASPAGIYWLLKSGISFRVGYFGAAAICLISAALALTAARMKQERQMAAHEDHTRWQMILSDRTVLILALGVLLYVGAEIGQSTWLSVYFKRDLGADDPLSASSLSYMWFGIGLGRIAAAWASKHMPELAIVRMSLALAATCQAALLLLKVPVPGLIAAFGLGLFLGPVFPTLVSCAGAIYPRHSGKVTSIVVAAGCLGGAIFPPTIGWAADAIGLRTALWICCAILAIDVAMFATNRRFRTG